jgi:hypothetical protein
MDRFLFNLAAACALGAAACPWLAAIAVTRLEAAPAVELYAPAVAQVGTPFEVSAEVTGCSPSRWAWDVQGGAVKAPAATGAPPAEVTCASQRCTVTATAIGGGCAKARGVADVVALAADQEPPACSPLPYRPVLVDSRPWGYQPAIQSTGRLDLRLQTYVEVCQKPRGFR